MQFYEEAPGFTRGFLNYTAESEKSVFFGTNYPAPATPSRVSRTFPHLYSLLMKSIGFD